MQRTRYLVNPDIVCRRESEGVLLFNPDTNTALGSNSVGYLIWQALQQPCTPDEIIAHLVETCQDVPADQVAADVDEFLQVLQPGGFVGTVFDEDGRFSDAATARRRPPTKESLWHTPPDQDTLLFYHGNSMWGTFRPGDYLAIEPVPLVAIQPGDVVVFRGREQGGKSAEIVHRVVDVLPGGLVTQGDNNPKVDTELVTQDSLLGRVIHVERKGRVHPVHGGRWGLLRVRVLQTWQAARRLGWQLLKIVGQRPYRWLRESGLVRRLWRPALTQVCIETEGSPVVKYLHRGRTVAWWWPERGRFLCCKPYDLVISKPEQKGYSPL